MRPLPSPFAALSLYKEGPQMGVDPYVPPAPASAPAAATSAYHQNFQRLPSFFTSQSPAEVPSKSGLQASHPVATWTCSASRNYTPLLRGSLLVRLHHYHYKAVAIVPPGSGPTLVAATPSPISCLSSPVSA